MAAPSLGRRACPYFKGLSSWDAWVLASQLLGGPAWTDRLDQMTSKGPFQPHPFYDSVNHFKVLHQFLPLSSPDCDHFKLCKSMCWAADPVAVACLAVSTFMMECKGFRRAFSWHCSFLISSFLSPPVTQSPSLVHQDNYFPFYFGNLWKKTVRRELWRSPDFSCFSDLIAQGIVQVNFGFGRVEIPPSLWGWVAVFVMLLNLLFLCAQLEFPLLWLVTVDCWVSTAACLWGESVPGCSVFLWRMGNCWGPLCPFPFSWLNKSSSLTFSLQGTGLQLQQPSCLLSVQFVNITPVLGDPSQTQYPRCGLKNAR